MVEELPPVTCALESLNILSGSLPAAFPQSSLVFCVLKDVEESFPKLCPLQHESVEPSRMLKFKTQKERVVFWAGDWAKDWDCQAMSLRDMGKVYYRGLNN